MRPLPAALLGIVLLGGVGAGLWLAFRDDDAPPPDDAGPARRDEPPDDPEPRTPRYDEGPEPPIPEWSPSDEKTPPTFDFPQVENLAGPDWRQVGIEIRKARKRLVEQARRLEQGAESWRVFPEAAGQVMGVVQAVQPLHMTFLKGFDPRMGDPIMPFGTMLAHPAVESNALAATLAAWDRPLTAEQAAKVKPLYDEVLAVWTEERGHPVRGAWTLESLAKATRARAAIQPRLEEVLDEKQRAALWPPELKGRVMLDFFSAAALWRDRIFLVEVRPGDDLAINFGGLLRADLPIRPEVEAEYTRLIDRWLAERSPEWLRGVRGPLSRATFVTDAEILAALEPLPPLVRRIHDSGWVPEVPPDAPKLQLVKVLLLSRLKR